jgi:ribose-phosphate pyrophosphokinase
MHELGKFARDHFKPHNPMVIGPDEEAGQWAEVVAKELEAEHTVFRKVRVRKEGMTSSRVEVDAGEINLRGRDVVFADDIISTGGTIAEAAKACKKRGAKRIFVVCTHPVLAEGALKRIKAAGVQRVIGTDTYPGPVSKVSVAPAIASALKS